jgi:hypothetical protein
MTTTEETVRNTIIELRADIAMWTRRRWVLVASMVNIGEANRVGLFGGFRA